MMIMVVYEMDIPVHYQDPSIIENEVHISDKIIKIIIRHVAEKNGENFLRIPGVITPSAKNMHN